MWGTHERGTQLTPWVDPIVEAGEHPGSTKAKSAADWHQYSPGLSALGICNATGMPNIENTKKKKKIYNDNCFTIIVITFGCARNTCRKQKCNKNANVLRHFLPCFASWSHCAALV